MNLLLLEADELGVAADASIGSLIEASCTIDEDRARHLVRVLGVHEGTVIRAGVVDGPVGSATVRRVARPGTGLYQVTLDVLLDHPPPPALDARLVLALPRPKFLGRILQWVTTMGVKDIHLIGCERVERSYWESSLLAPAALRRHLMLGLEQGRDTLLPRIETTTSFTDFCERILLGLLEPGPVWLAHAEAKAMLPYRIETPATLCIGPEGGWLAEEVERLAAAGVRPASLGLRPLRVEAAVAVTLGRCLGGS